VAFADLVGFTELGESVEAEELGGLAQRLTDLAEEAGRGPVRLVKTIGDAVMLVAPEPAPLLDATLEMVESAEGEGLPPLRAGLAFGPAVNRWGDWYGSTVNLASRLCSRARPRSVLIPADLRDHLGDAAERYTFSQAGQKRLKGVASPVPTLRVRPAGPLL
jgi:adenylate cyclase